MTSGTVQKGLRSLNGRQVYVYATPLLRDDKPAGALAVFLDAAELGRSEWERWRFNAIRFLVLALVLSLIAWLIVRMSITRPLARMAGWTRALRRGESITPLELSDAGLFGPMAREVSVLASSLHRARAAAEEEATLRLIGETQWTEERLKQFAKLRLGEAPARRRVQPRARAPRVARGSDRRGDPGERPRDRDGSGDAGVRRRLGGAGQRGRRPGIGRRSRAASRAPGRSAVHPAPRVAHGGGGGGLLQRLLERGALAALPHRAHAPAIPPGRLAPLPGGEREVRRRRAGGDRGHGVADGPDPGLPLRAPARAHQARATGRAHRDLLAHPVAELRELQHLPVAGRAPPRHARRRPHRLPHPVLLQQLPRDRGAGASRVGPTGSASR